MKQKVGLRIEKNNTNHAGGKKLTLLVGINQCHLQTSPSPTISASGCRSSVAAPQRVFQSADHRGYIPWDFQWALRSLGCTSGSHLPATDLDGLDELSKVVVGSRINYPLVNVYIAMENHHL